MLRAITPIRHDGTRYNPGDVLPEMSTKAETRLIECGAAERIDVPTKSAAATTAGGKSGKSTGGKGRSSAGSKPKDSGKTVAGEASSVQLPAGIDPNLAPEE
ncbi:MAG: hypothetical protein ABFD64_09400 [Armatimonadota bacterium]